MGFFDGTARSLGCQASIDASSDAIDCVGLAWLCSQGMEAVEAAGCNAGHTTGTVVGL
jgi:hypothetical protein